MYYEKTTVLFLARKNDLQPKKRSTSNILRKQLIITMDGRERCALVSFVIFCRGLLVLVVLGIKLAVAAAGPENHNVHTCSEENVCHMISMKAGPQSFENFMNYMEKCHLDKPYFNLVGMRLQWH